MPPPRRYVVVVMADRSRAKARYSRINHVWLTRAGAVVWPRWWVEEAHGT